MLTRFVILVCVGALFVWASLEFARPYAVRTGYDATPAWMERNRLPREAHAGAMIVSESGCLQCHVYLGAGSRNVGAPDLSAEGLRGRGVEWQMRHLRDPRTPIHRSRGLRYGDNFSRR